MSEQSEISCEQIDHGSPIRASFSMDRGSREAIRWVAERYGVDQSDVVNLAPVLFVILAEATLNKRRERLAQLEITSRQATANLEGMAHLAPHLGIFAEALGQAVGAVLEGERTSIDRAEIVDVGYGVMEKKENILGDLTHHVDDRMIKIYMSSPLIQQIIGMAKTAGMVVDQDTQGDDGAACFPYSMILKLGDGRTGNLAVSAHRRNCQVVATASMDELVSTRDEKGYEPTWVSNFTGLLA